MVDHSDALIAELRRADTIVLAVPLYNFGIPSLTGKHAVVFAARGGRYAGTPLDTQTPYLRAFLGFVGIDDVEFVYAEGLAIDEENRTQSLSAAHARIEALIEPALQAA